MYHAHIHQNKAEGTYFQRENNFWTKEVFKDKEEHCIIMKGSVLPEDRAIRNVNAPNS